MAIQEGGLFGRVRGNVGGVVFGAARGRTGKLVTAREKVSPSNPQTSAQVLQRGIFSTSLYATRYLTASLWQDYFNRSIGQLPGYQSMMSILLNNTDSSKDFNTPADTPLGDLHFPASFSAATGAGATKTIDVTFDTSNGINGTASDTLRFFFIGKSALAGDERQAGFLITSALRSAGSATLTVPSASTVYQLGCFVVGAGTADGLLSLCRWSEVTSNA